MNFSKNFLVILVIVLGGYLLFGQTITVTRPAKGTVWNRGMSWDITWKISGNMYPTVKIRLYNRDATKKVLDIVNKTKNDGKHPWFIPASLVPGEYVVRVKTFDNKVFDDSSVFKISSQRFVRMAPKTREDRKRIQMSSKYFTVNSRITVINPVKNETHLDNEPFYIKWKTSGVVLNRIKIDVVKRKYGVADKVYPVVSDIKDSGVYKWSPKPVSWSEDIFEIRISTLDNKVTALSPRFYFGSYQKLQKTRQDFLTLINQYRQSKGLNTLILDNCMNKAAQLHSQWMNETGKFSHTGANGSSHSDRCRTAGCTCNYENIATGSSAKDVFTSWKNSPGHNANMLRKGITRLGLGASFAYWTAVFR